MVETVGASAILQVQLILSQGADNLYQFIWSAGTPDVSVDLTGWTASGQIRNTVGGTVWLQLDPYITLNNVGVVQILIPDAITNTPTWVGYANDTGVFDVELTAPSGGVTRFVEGTVVVMPSVTRNV